MFEIFKATVGWVGLWSWMSVTWHTMVVADQIPTWDMAWKAGLGLAIVIIVVHRPMRIKK